VSTKAAGGATGLLSSGRLFALSLGKKRALKEEFERVAIPHLQSLYTSAFYLTRNSAAAEDLVQETYLRAYRFFHKFRPGTNCRAWLLTIQRRLFLNQYRQKKHEPEWVDLEKLDRDYEAMLAGEPNGRPSDPEAIFCLKSLGDEVASALGELPEDFRTAIVLVDIEGLTYDEAAEVMECPVGTIRSRLSRGRRMLQLALKDYAAKRNLNER
jgi:RNA polymerase sigma-70 factor (ECF subfamily)